MSRQSRPTNGSLAGEKRNGMECLVEGEEGRGGETGHI